ncbi:MAG: Inner membrane protein YphA [Chlamydiae bacterium]|nr:Inner membrane protein YphA [Chlamydiota bacterium]
MGESCCSTKTTDCGKEAGPFFGRFLISLIFILAGTGKFFDFGGAVEALRQMGIHGAGVYAVLGLILELVGGILVLLGWYTRLGVYLLMIFLLPTTLIFHGFWNYSGPEMALQLSIFLKNLTIYGGLLYILSYGPGKWSLDACRICKPKE